MPTTCARRTRSAATPAALVLVAGASLGCAVWVTVAGVTVPVVSLPFGLFVLAAVSTLLSLKPVTGLCRRTNQPSGSTVGDAQALWHTGTVAEVAARLKLSPDGYSGGLTAATAAERAAVFGPNALPSVSPPPVWQSVVKEVHEPQQVLLLVVAVLYALVGEVEEASLALGVILLMIFSEVLTETRAKHALASLQTSAPVFAHVMRDGAGVTVPRDEVVPGDVVLLRAGFEVPADCRLLQSSQLTVDESRLTGEALPVSKRPADGVADATPLAERENMVHSGCTVAHGTGSALEIGRAHV